MKKKGHRPFKNPPQTSTMFTNRSPEKEFGPVFQERKAWIWVNGNEAGKKRENRIGYAAR